MRTWFIRFLVSRAGTWLSLALSFGVAWLVAKAAVYLPDWAERVNQGEIVAALWALCMWGIHAATNRWLTKDAKVIQQALADAGTKCNVDGWIGKETISDFEKVTGRKVRRATPARIQIGLESQG